MPTTLVVDEHARLVVGTRAWCLACDFSVLTPPRDDDPEGGDQAAQLLEVHLMQHSRADAAAATFAGGRRGERVDRL